MNWTLRAGRLLLPFAFLLRGVTPAYGFDVPLNPAEECAKAIVSYHALEAAKDVQGSEARASTALALCQSAGVPDAMRAEALLIAKWSGNASLSEAAARTETAFAIATKVEPRGALLIRATEDLSTIRFQQRQPEEAERLFQDAWDLRCEIFESGSEERISGHARFAAGFLSLAQLYEEMGAGEVARGHVIRALRESRSAFRSASSIFGRGHRVTVEAAIVLHAALRENGDGMDAERIYGAEVEPFTTAQEDGQELP